MWFSKKPTAKPKKPITTEFLKSLDKTISDYRTDLETYQNLDTEERISLARKASQQLLENHYRLITQWSSEVV
jgi:hypothetical protein